MTAHARWAALAGSVVVAAAAGLLLPANAWLGVVALAVLALGGVVALNVVIDRQAAALLLLIATAVAFPVEFRGPAGVMMSSSLPLAAGLCALWILRQVVTRDPSAFDRSRVVVSAMTFLGLTIVSFVMGQFPWFDSPGAPLPAQVVELGLFSLSVCLFLAVGHQVRRIEQLQWLTWVFLITGAFACMVQTIPQMASVGRLTTRPGSIGSMFWTWFVAIGAAQALTNRHLPIPIRLTILGFVAMALGHGLFQVRSWASGWVPALIAIGVIVVVRWPRLAIGGGLLALPVGLALSGDIIASLLVEESYSLATRTEAWRVLWQIAERSPILGTGLANYYYFAENFSILGWYVPFISHNNYEDLLVQTGLLGLIVFLWFGLEVILMAFRLCLKAPAGFPLAYALGLLGGTVGSLSAGMLGDWIIPFYYNGGVLGFRSSLLFWVFVGGGLALRRMLAAQPVRVAVVRPAVEPARRGLQVLAPSR
jgi:hypothetical protein